MPHTLIVATDEWTMWKAFARVYKEVIRDTREQVEERIGW